MKRTGHARNIEKIRMHTKFWSENLNGRHYSGETGVNGKILKSVGVKEDDDVNCFHTAKDISVIKWHKISSCIIQTVLSIQASTIIRRDYNITNVNLPFYAW